MGGDSVHVHYEGRRIILVVNLIGASDMLCMYQHFLFLDDFFYKIINFDVLCTSAISIKCVLCGVIVYGPVSASRVFSLYPNL